MTKASEGELGALHGVVARYLAEKIASGEASASDVSNAIKLLKDNNITCNTDPGSDLDKLNAALQARTRVQPADSTDLSSALEQLKLDRVN